MDRKEPRSVPVIVMVAVAVLAAALIGLFGYRTLVPSGGGQATKAADTRRSIEDMARKSGGDYTKLSPDEQKLLDATYRGNGQRALHNVYKSLTESGGQ